MPIEVVDLFCGIGGLTRGLINAGINVVAGFDVDETCRFAYETNNYVRCNIKNIRDVTGEEINNCYGNNSFHILVGCAPCQPFSQMRFKYGDHYNYEDDKKYDLLLEYGRIIQETQPQIVSMENVPNIRNTSVYEQFLQILNINGYHTWAKVVYCPDYGISQNRRRFVLLASKLGEIGLISPTHDCDHRVTVRDVIEDLPIVGSGEVAEADPMHRTAKLSEKNIQRIRVSVPGGTWNDWPEEMRCKCHREESGKTFSSVYGRMEWDKVGPTMTTEFYCYGTGRFGHPEQDRALTLREGALLQTFPRNYNFIDPNRPFSLKHIARHIGNAVPVRLGEIIGMSIMQHLKKYQIEK